MKILVVEDDADTAAYVADGLRESGHTVDVAPNGRDGLFLAADGHYDAMVVDRMLPGIDGIRLVQTIRAAGVRSPVIFLSARGSVPDRVSGLDAGADDYLPKPFALEELLARIKALLRRRVPPELSREILCFADLELDTVTRQARRGKRVIDLSTTEYELLALFLRNPRAVLTRGLLMERIWGSDFEGGPNVLEVYIGHLRAKLEQQGEHRLLQTVRGAGYVLRLLEQEK